MTSTPAQFAMKMHRAANGITDADRQIATLAAMIVKRSAQRELAIAAPRGRMNVGKRGQRVGVRFDMRSDDSVVVRMTGPAHLLERDTKGHRIPREFKGRGRSRGRNVKKLLIPGIGVRMSADHPGTKGKEPWKKGLATALPRLPRVAGEHYFGTVRKALR